MRAAAENSHPGDKSALGSSADGSHANPNYRADVDGLRALAIIPVVVFHAFPSLLPGGFVGVDIFFVISGFLITGIVLQSLERGTFSFAGFYSNRIKRLFPALLLVLAVCMAAGWFVLLPNEYQSLGKHTVGAVSYVENFVLRREAANYFDTQSYLKPLLHLWSLGVEEQFYLTYPLFLWLTWRLAGRLQGKLLAVLLLLAVISFGLNMWQVRSDVVGDFFLPQTRWWELMAGGAIASSQFLQRKTGARVEPSLQRVLRNCSSVVGLLLVAVATFRIHDTDRFPGWWALLPVAGASFLIMGGPGAWINRRVLANRAMVFVGLVSYPLYLWHWPVLTIPRMIRGGKLPLLVSMAGVALSFSLAWATWRFVEKPIRFGRKNSARKNWIEPVALATASLMIGFLGYVAYAHDGFVGRFPQFLGDIGPLYEIQWATPECRQRVGLPEIDYCLTTSAAAPDLLLIGDSHASVLYRGLGPAAAHRSVAVMNLGQAGCVPFYDTDSFSPGVRHRDCRPVVNRMLDFAASSAARTIVLSLRAPLYMSGRGFGPADAAAAPKEILWDAVGKPAPQAEVFAAAFRNTISRLGLSHANVSQENASHKNLILFLDWPELGFDPMSCLPRPLRALAGSLYPCSVPRAEVDARNRPFRVLVSQLQKEFPDLKVFDPLPYLCDSSQCYGMKDGHLLYSDDNHPSDAGAAYLAEKFFVEQALAGLMRPTSLSVSTLLAGIPLAPTNR